MKKIDPTDKLLPIMPACIEVQNSLLKIRDEISDKLNYYEAFSSRDKPTILVLYKLQEVGKLIIKARKTLFTFDSEFDKNELSQKVKEVYTDIFIKIEGKDLIKRTGSIKIGAISSLWPKNIRKIIRTWESLEYRAKVGYSKEAYYHLKNYMQLIYLIEKLEKLVLIY